MNKLIGQHLIIGISGTSLTSDEKSFIIENNIGGVVLFARNLSNPAQIHGLCTEIQMLRNHMIEKTPLFIALDMEGGRVSRLKEPFTQWPPLKKLGDLDNATVTFNYAQKLGMEIRSVGINLNFSPCVDIFTNPANTVIGDRAIGKTPEIVDKHTSALIRGFIKAGVMSCAKHFPGHGNTLIDSHLDLPVESSDEARLDKIEYVPFKKAFKSRVDFVMTAHILFSKIDSEWPASLSEYFLKKKIREDYRYRGLIITDDLDMKALTKKYSKEQIAVRALSAGSDMLLYCNEPDSPGIALEAITEALAQGILSKENLQTSYKRIMDTKRSRLEQPDPFPLTEALNIIGNAQHKALAEGIAAGHVPENLIAE